jgi:hypothetical protein
MNAPVAIELAWEQSAGDEACIGREEVATRVEKTLGHRVFARPGDEPAAATLHGHVGADAAGRGWIAVVEVRRADKAPLRRELRLSARDCRQLDDAIVLVVALMVDASEFSPLPLTIAGAAPTISVSLGPDVAVAAGLLPGVATGIGLTTQTDLPHFWPVAVWGHGWLPSEARAAGSGGRMTAWTFGAAVCPWTLRLNRWELLACAGGSGGVVYSDGIGLDISHHQVRPYAQAEIQANARFRIVNSFFARVGFAAALPLIRTSYTYTQGDGSRPEVFRTAPVIPLGTLAIEIGSPP